MTFPSRSSVTRLVASVMVALFAGNAWGQDASSAEGFRVSPVEVADQKSVFATVESTNVVPARVRIGGTVAVLTVDEGDRVEEGAVVAVVGDEKLALQTGALNARISALVAQRDQAQTELDRANSLFERGVIAKARLDDVQTRFDVVSNELKSARADRSVIAQQQREGEVLAPATGVVLRVPVTNGTVVLPGEPVAEIAQENYVLRLRLPERHARFMAEGDPVRIENEASDGAAVREGRIVQVYPEIVDGRVVADVYAEGLGDFFVGERRRVWVATDRRVTFVVPADYIETRFGVDYAYLRRSGAAEPVAVVVQRGRPLATEAAPDGIEILAGLQGGDVLVKP